MEFKTEANPRIALTLDGKVEITFITYKAVMNGFEDLKDKELNVKVTPFSKKRSLTQNAYMWVLLGELASKLKITKDEAYKHFIKDYGLYEVIPIKNEAVEMFNRCWTTKGIGWFTETLRESKLEGYTTLLVYYGSSSYDSNQMSKLVDAIVNDCQEVGISTMTLSEIMLLKNENDESR